MKVDATPLTDDDIEVRHKIMRICGIQELDSVTLFSEKILLKLDELIAENRRLNQSHIDAHLPLVEREITKLNETSEEDGLDYYQTKQLETLVKLKDFIHARPVSRGNGAEKLSEDELIDQLSVKTVSAHESD